MVHSISLRIVVTVVVPAAVSRVDLSDSTKLIAQHVWFTACIFLVAVVVVVAGVAAVAAVALTMVHASCAQPSKG